MASEKVKQAVQSLFQKANIQINGSRPWDIQIHNDQLYNRILRDGSLGFGEAYMERWWDAQRVDELITRALLADLQRAIGKNITIIWGAIKARLMNLQSIARAHQVGEQHYDLGNDLYQGMLDKRMNYSCGYWKNADNLDEAQEAKLDLICRKLRLKAGDRILDIGCGWGSLLQFAAERYGVTGLGTAVSKEQAKLARERLQNFPIEIRLQDYRKMDEEPFDHIISIGMFEHVGYKNYSEFMKIAAKHLKDDGLFLLHTIGKPQSAKSSDPWGDKYIFTNSMLPSMRQITNSIENVFEIEDLHNFRASYNKTLMAWHRNFNNIWDTIKHNYSDTFFRAWNYYLLACAGLFRSRKAHLWQFVLSKKGVKDSYESVR